MRETINGFCILVFFIALPDVNDLRTRLRLSALLLLIFNKKDK